VTLGDLQRLDAEARPGMRAAVVGGGLIGVEVAEVLHHRGLTVTFLVRESWYFPLALDAAEAAMVAEHVRAHGVDVRLGVNVEEVLRGEDGRIRGVRVAPAPGAATAGPAGGSPGPPGEVPCELLVSAIGVVPNTGFLRDSGLALSKGGAIEVDGALRASLPDVWAAGDCANVEWLDGSRRPEQLWYTARDQGRIAALSMLGDEAVYARGAWYNSAKFFDLEYTTAGWVPVLLSWDNTPLDPGPGMRCWYQRVPGRAESQRIVLEGDRVVGFNMLGSRWNHEPLLKWIHERRSLDDVLRRLAQAQFDEEFSRRFRVHEGAARLAELAAPAGAAGPA
jgi:NADPH-dependent 2,4-dienoyl-CoA reductase/sulfur reductase-like enzyme